MDVVHYAYPIDAILYMYLGATAIVSLIIGLLVWRLFKRRDIAFWTTLVLSFIGLSLALVWFQHASVAVFMGTLPWLINLFFSILLYGLFVGIIYVTFRARKLDRSK